MNQLEKRKLQETEEITDKKKPPWGDTATRRCEIYKCFCLWKVLSLGVLPFSAWLTLIVLLAAGSGAEDQRGHP